MSEKPKVVVLCGSTRFRSEFEAAFRDEEHAGNICLTVPCFEDDPCCKSPEDRARLDELHRRKIDLADEVVLIAPGAYVGESTRNELAYAVETGKPVRIRGGVGPYLAAKLKEDAKAGSVPDVWTQDTPPTRVKIGTKFRLVGDLPGSPLWVVERMETRFNPIVSILLMRREDGVVRWTFRWDESRKRRPVRWELCW